MAAVAARPGPLQGLNSHWRLDRSPHRLKQVVQCSVVSDKGTKLPVLVLPGFLRGANGYEEFSSTLTGLGHPSEVVPIVAAEWYPTVLGSSFEFYADKLAASVDSHYDEHGPLALVAHSAAGWIARICLGSIAYQGRVYSREDKVKALVTLGSPHLSVENYPFGRIKVYGSSVQFANYFYPRGDAFSGTEVVSIVSNFTKGRKLGFVDRLKQLYRNGGVPEDVERDDFAYASYLATCGEGSVDGDGVCPLESGLLPGSKHVVFDGVFHEPKSGLSWYGSPNIISRWQEHICIRDDQISATFG